MWYLLDLIIIAILLICIFIYAKRGFVKSVFSVIGFVAAIVLSFLFSGPLSNFTYQKAVEPAVSNAIESAITGTQGAINDNIAEALPDFIKNNIGDIDLTSKEFYDKANIDTPEMMADKICESVVKPTATHILEIIFFLILFIVLSIILKFVVKLLNKVFSFSIIGKLNAALGGVIGAVMGAIIAILFVLIINLVVSFNGEFAFFTAENINSTILFKLVLELTPINFL